MEDELKSGSLLVRADFDLPESLKVQGQAVLPGWIGLSGVDSHEIDNELKAHGWYFSYLVDLEPQARGVARTRHAAGQRALGKLVAKADSLGLNALEITGISVRRILFLCVATVVVNFRHIGKTPYLSEAATPKHRTTETKPLAAAAKAAA